MQNGAPKGIDTYAVLEFQGYVMDSPTYDRETKVLEFKAKAINRPPLKFVARGNVAKAFKSLLHHGCFIQVTALPKSHMVKMEDGSSAVSIEWEARTLTVLGSRKVNLGTLSDIRILDGLMPMEDEIEDVGYVEPYSFAKFQKRLEEANEEAARLKGEEHQHD